MKRIIVRALALLCAAALCTALLPAAALAQDFYGKGNVLIAVDMAPYAENEAVSYPEGTLGTLQWGEGAPTGVSSRPAFNAHPYTVSPDVTLPQAPDYAIETTYTVGQKVLFPYYRADAPEYAGDYWISADAFPPEVFAPGAPRFLTHSSCVKTEGGETWYKMPYEIVQDGAAHACADFLEIECVAVTEHSTVWQYTGTAYSNRTGFDPDDYVGAVELTAEEIQYFNDTCDEAYTVQGQVYGDPRWEDRRGDCDGKAAYVVLDLSTLEPKAAAFYSEANTDLAGFDCLAIGANMLPGRRGANAWQAAEDFYTGTLTHELNHYIVSGCIGHENERWSMWVGEALAQSAIYAVRPESTDYLAYRSHITDYSSRLRVIPGMLWGDQYHVKYPAYNYMAYTLGPHFLRYIERETTGQADGRLWTNYFAQRTPEGSITGAELNGYLTETTGEGLDAWMARFIAAAVVGAQDGSYCMGEASVTAEHRVDPYVFFRPWEEYGTGLSFDGAAENAIRDVISFNYNITAVAGGGTAYAWRNDAGGKIAVTGADDRWRFFAVDMDLPGERGVIDIASAEELAKIGRDPDYLLSGRYRLTADIDLGGADHPWTPIGLATNDPESFTGEFDGNGHTIRGLYVNNPNSDKQGLFSMISGNAEIHDLTVYGSVTGKGCVGALVGYLIGGGTVRGCESHVTVTGASQVGGIVGYHWLGKIEDCTAAGVVSGDYYIGGIVGFGSWATITNSRVEAPVTGDAIVGGFVGYNDGCTITGCRNSGDVTGSIWVGGIVGYIDQYGTVRACYQTGAVRGTKSVGGIVGEVWYDSTVRDCYSAGAVSGEARVGGVAGFTGYAELADCYSYQPGLPAVGGVYADDDGDTATVTGCYTLSETETGEGYLTAAQFAHQSSFAGWDFETVWTLENGVRPELRSNRETITPTPDPTPWYPDEPVPTPAPKPAEQPKQPEPVAFGDVAESDWFYAAVQFVAQKGYFLGTGNGSFSPSLPMTRGMFLTVLARVAGETIDGADWQEKAVAWAVENGISDGSSPEAPVTREQLVTLLWRFCGKPAGSADLSGFTDAGEISIWASEAMRWAVGIGLIQGRGGGILAPGGEATRAEVAQILMNYLTQESR